MIITDVKGMFTLRNGVEMPYLGLGVFECKNDSEVINAVKWALELGYRHIDTASFYKNEEGVGRAIRESGMRREELFVVSKLWNSDHGYQKTIDAFELTLRRLNMDYLDLYLIHWPVKGKFVESWKALEYLYEKGRIMAIGVSNFLKHHLDELLIKAEIVPMVNQMEFHPHLVQQELLNFCQSKGIQYEAWSPLMRGEIFNIQKLRPLEKKYDKTVTQIVLRWNLQKGVITIPKSSKKERIASNADIFDFEISKEDMTYIDSFDQDRRIGPHPDHFNF